MNPNNPYEAPKARLEDTASVAVTPPRFLTYAVALLIGSAFFNFLADFGASAALIRRNAGLGLTLVGAMLVTLIGTIVLSVLMIRGRAWARSALIWVFSIGALAHLVQLPPTLGTWGMPDGIALIVSTVVHLGAFFALFLPVSNAWFSRG